MERHKTPLRQHILLRYRQPSIGNEGPVPRMLIELLVCFSLIFLIATLFYKQRRSDFSVLQLDAEQIDEQLTDLLEEGQPIVVRGVQPPKGLTRDSLQKIHRLAEFPVGGLPLHAILQNPAALSQAAGKPVFSQEDAVALADELAIPVWAEPAWLGRLNQFTMFGAALGTLRTECMLGGVGLTRGKAIVTCIFVTEGKYTASILMKDSERFLPSRWEYRYPSTFTVNDTPLVSDLKYLDIVLRPGTALLIPSHTIYSLQPSGEDTAFHAAAVLEYHEPISLIAKSI